MIRTIDILAGISLIILSTYLMTLIMSARNQRISRNNQLIEKEKNVKLVYPPDRKPNFNFEKEPIKTNQTDGANH